MNQPNRKPPELTEPLEPPHRQVQIQADQLVGRGRPGQAAPLFAKLAEVESSDHPQMAASLHAQAAHAFADSQQGPAALLQARTALRLFLKNKMIERVPVFYADITRKLNAGGMQNEADALISEFKSRIPVPAATASAAQGHGILPTNCPNCGAPVHGEKSGWVDANTFECEFCGSLIRPV